MRVQASQRQGNERRQLSRWTPPRETNERKQGPTSTVEVNVAIPCRTIHTPLSHEYNRCTTTERISQDTGGRRGGGGAGVGLGVRMGSQGGRGEGGLGLRCGGTGRRRTEVVLRGWRVAEAGGGGGGEGGTMGGGKH